MTHFRYTNISIMYTVSVRVLVKNNITYICTHGELRDSELNVVKRMYVYCIDYIVIKTVQFTTYCLLLNLCCKPFDDREESCYVKN